MLSGALSVARGMPGTISQATPRRSSARNIAQDAEREIPVVQGGGERFDFFARAAQEERRTRDGVAQNRHAFAFQEEHEFGRRQDRDRAADAPQRLPAAERQQIGIARSEADDAKRTHPRALFPEVRRDASRGEASVTSWRV
jgi:hypothetical protein